MNCSPTIAIALLLLSLTAGMWLLYKTQKENLGVFFKIVGWFIIVMSIGSMLCCGVRCILKCCKQKQSCEYTEQCVMNMNDCMGRGKHGMEHRGMSKCIMIMKGDDECYPGSRHEWKGCCKEGKEECEDIEKETEINKDTVVIKEK